MFFRYFLNCVGPLYMAIKILRVFFSDNPVLSDVFSSQWPTSLAVTSGCPTMRCGRLPSRSDVNKRIQRISKVAHSSGQWTEFGVDKMLIRSIRSYSARRKVYGDKMRYLSLPTGVYIYIKLKFGHSSGIISN